MSTEKKEEGPRSFARFIEQVADGELHSELSDELHDLVKHLEHEASARGSSAAGLLTLKIGVKVDDRGIATIGFDVSTKKPKAKKSNAVMWVTQGGNLTPENPKQQKLPLREVAKDAPPREVGAATNAAIREV